MSDHEKAQARDKAVAEFARTVPLVNGQAIRAAWRLWDAGAAPAAEPARTPPGNPFPRVPLPPFEPLQAEDLLAGPQIYSSVLLRADRDNAYRVINALVRRFADGAAHLPDGAVEAEQPVISIERRRADGGFTIKVAGP